MDINEERQTELLWRRIVDLRSREASVPLDDRAPEMASGELCELQRLAEHTSEVMNAEVMEGRLAARERLVKFIGANPIAPRAKARPPLLSHRLSQRSLLAIAILLFAVAIAIAAANYIVPAYQAGCGTGAGDTKSMLGHPPKVTQQKP